MVDAAAGAVTIGARSVFVIVITVTALPDRVFEAVNVTVSEPASLYPGVHANVPPVLAPLGVNVAPAGRFAAVSDVMVWLSGSAAVTVNESGAFSATATEAGAETTGAWSTPFTVIEVVALPASAFCAVNVTA